MEPTIWRFLLFLGSELLFLITIFAGMIILGIIIAKKRAIKSHYIFLVSLISTVLSTVFLILFTRILTGDGHLFVFGVIAVVSVILMLIVELMWLIFGGSDVPWVGRILWTNYEFQQLAPTVNKILQLISALTFVIYPIYIGLGYFGDEFSRNDWPQYVLRATLIVLIGITWLSQLPSIIFVLTSRNVMEGTRSRLFMTQLSNSASLLVLLSILIWTFNRAGVTIPLLGKYFVFSSTVGYTIAAYLLLILVFPYLIGHYRTKHWVEKLDRDWRNLVDEVTKGLSSLTLAKAVDALDVLEIRIGERIDELYNERSMKLANRVARTDEKHLFVQRLALTEGLKRDPRFVHLERLLEIDELIKDCRSELSNKDQDNEKREILKACVELLTEKKEKEVSSVTSTRAYVLIALTTVTTSLANPILSAVGKFIVSKLGFKQ